MNKRIVAVVVTLILAILTPLLVVSFDSVRNYLTRATAQPANIVVDYVGVVGALPPTWRALAQGGEEGVRTFVQVRDELKELAPSYVRIDHIYDTYNVVDRSNGQLVFDFSQLDQTVRDILVSGAMPFFTLTYMPEELSSDGSIVGSPSNWLEWQLLVQKTVERYSGKSGFGLENVYYEVWNEPDLFGGWKMYGDKSYLELYKYSVLGAQRAENVNNYYIGGPGTTAPYKNWVKGLVVFARDNGLALDFISWHRYTGDPGQFGRDVNDVEIWLAEYPGYNELPFIISEFGYDSENNSAFDQDISAAHTVAAIREVISSVELVFSFEVKDGLSPGGEEYWGRWGVLTHDKFGNTKKPRYYALKLLNQLNGGNGRLLRVAGEGEYVKAIGLRDLSSVKLVLVNYDAENRNAEQVPIKIINLPDGEYNIREEDIKQNITNATISVLGGVLTHSVIMPPNSVVLLTIVKQ